VRLVDEGEYTLPKTAKGCLCDYLFVLLGLEVAAGKQSD